MKKKDLIEISITSVLVLVLLSAVINSMAKVRMKKQARVKRESARVERPQRPPGSLKKDPGGLSEGETLFSSLEKRTQGLTTERDPFGFGGIMASDKQVVVKLRLTGILWDPSDPKAIIDDYVYGLGDDLEGAKIIEIRHDRVILSDGTNNFELRLK